MNSESRQNSTAIVAITRRGVELGRRLSSLLLASELYLPQKFSSGTKCSEHAFSSPVKQVVGEIFSQYRYLVLIMAAGAAVRLIAPHLKDKHKDPAVVVVDEVGKFAVSLLSGHLGGANEMAEKIASLLNAQPIITTASDVSGTISVDLLGKDFGWQLEDSKHVTGVSAAMVNGEPVGVYQDAGERDWWSESRSLPENVRRFDSIESLCRARPRAALIITDRIVDKSVRLPLNTVTYRPRSLVVGIGCNRGTKSGVIEEAVCSVFSAHGLSVKSISNLATIDIKENEVGLLEFSRKYKLPIDYFGKEALRGVTSSPNPSPMVKKHVGTPAVCEAAALLSSGSSSLIVPKQRFRGAVTIAVARLPAAAKKTGKLFLVGIGPGSPEQMTMRAREAIGESEVVVGYTAYIKLIEPMLVGKEVIATGMGAEVERAKTALSLARQGRRASIISSGDAGIYGMAGLVGEILREQPGEHLDVEVVPGVTSLVAVAALLGSPVTTDFASISLSDHLISWESITRRLEMATQGDFVIALYNPKSKKRRHQVEEAREIVTKYRPPTTPVGIVTNAFREQQQVVITDLEHMLDYEIGMNTTVIIGNSTTFTVNGWMVTPRGYQTKYDLSNEAPQ